MVPEISKLSPFPKKKKSSTSPIKSKQDDQNVSRKGGELTFENGTVVSGEVKQLRHDEMSGIGIRKDHLNNNTKKSIHFVTYTLSSATFVLMNRALLRRFHHPLFVTAFQQIIVALSYCMVAYLGGQKKKKKNNQIFSREGAQSIWSCAVFFVMMVAMNNICLRFTPVSGYVIARASTLVFNMLLSSIFLHQYPSKGGILSILTVVAAIFIGSDLNTLKSAEAAGVITGLLASAAQAAFSCSVSQALAKTKQSPLYIMGHYTIMSLFIIVPIVAANIEPLPTLDTLFKLPNISLLFMTGLMNVVVALTAVSSLQMSNPITVNLLGYVKSVGQSLLGVWLLNEPLTMNKGVGLALTIVGSFGYSMSRLLSKRPKK